MIAEDKVIDWFRTKASTMTPAPFFTDTPRLIGNSDCPVPCMQVFPSKGRIRGRPDDNNNVTIVYEIWMAKLLTVGGNEANETLGGLRQVVMVLMDDRTLGGNALQTRVMEWNYGVSPGSNQNTQTGWVQFIIEVDHAMVKDTN